VLQPRPGTGSHFNDARIMLVAGNLQLAQTLRSQFLVLPRGLHLLRCFGIRGLLRPLSASSTDPSSPSLLDTRRTFVPESTPRRMRIRSSTASTVSSPRTAQATSNHIEQPMGSPSAMGQRTPRTPRRANRARGRISTSSTFPIQSSRHTFGSMSPRLMTVVF
jgi:hypothetical protein